MVLGIDFVESIFVYEEVSVYWNGHNDWAVIEDFLLDIGTLRRNTVVPNLKALTLLSSSVALRLSFSGLSIVLDTL